MRSRRSASYLFLLAALTLGGAAQATNPTVTCLKAARGDDRGCKAAANESWQVAKDGCLNRDHACVELCRGERGVCADATALDAALTACADAFEAGRAICRSQFVADTPERDACIDQTQVTAFQCRDTARELAKPALRLCRTGFQTCARACGPLTPPNPADPKQCKADAADAFQTDKAGCVEDFQVAKDNCLMRDHACVELCRVDRHSCKAPILATFDAAKDACNATRDGAVDICKTLYADGTPERNACIDLAQVTAFSCRDDAREAAHPGLEACRQGFRACAQSCPAPAPAP
jgi:hypothetical protein